MGGKEGSWAGGGKEREGPIPQLGPPECQETLCVVGHCFFLCPLRLCLLRSLLPRDHRERLLLADFPGISAREASARHRLSSSQDLQHQ